jgi:hypothetical protein
MIGAQQGPVLAIRLRAVGNELTATRSDGR